MSFKQVQLDQLDWISCPSKPNAGRSAAQTLRFCQILLLLLSVGTATSFWLCGSASDNYIMWLFINSLISVELGRPCDWELFRWSRLQCLAVDGWQSCTGNNSCITRRFTYIILFWRRKAKIVTDIENLLGYLVVVDFYNLPPSADVSSIIDSHRLLSCYINKTTSCETA